MAENTEEESIDRPPNTQSENSSEEIIPTNDTETINPNQETENMEVHHHPDLHHRSKKWKEYFLEFLMIFLAVTLGFIAENFRENIVNREKEKHYIENVIADLKTDTANITLSVHMQNLLVKKMEAVLEIPVERLDDLSMQNTLYQNLVPFYAS